MVTVPRAAHTHGVLLAALAFGVLACGALLYLAERDPARVWLMPAGWSIAPLRGLLPAVVRDNGPSFLHAYAFSVLTALCLAPRARSVAIACGGWLAIEMLFEIGQHAKVARLLIEVLPQGLASTSAFARVAGYFTSGTFDPFDLIASALGVAAACATLTWPPMRKRSTS